MKLEVGKTYAHATSIDDDNTFKIVEACSHLFVGENTVGKRWLFDEDGRSVACFGSTIIPKFALKEIPVEETVFIRMNSWGDTSVHYTDPHGYGITSIKLSIKDGIPVAAELVRPCSFENRIESIDDLDPLP